MGFLKVIACFFIKVVYFYGKIGPLSINAFFEQFFQHKSLKMKQLSLAFSVMLIFIVLSCETKTTKAMQKIETHSTHELGKKRLEAKTLTAFLAIGEQLDTVAKSYAELKYDSIEAINFEFEFIRPVDGMPRDSILNRHRLNATESAHLIKVLDAKKSYDFEFVSKCFEPHMTFIFYSKDTIVAYCSICFYCRNSYATIKAEDREGETNLSDFGLNSLTKMCKAFHFSYCKSSK
jgi:hypothetical protein